jgi:ribonuclease G
MKRDIVVDVGPHETRVAILEDGQLAEYKIEREEEVVGNVYVGRVENVVRGLDAAFVEVGIERNVFLHVSDAMPEEPSRHQMRRKMGSFPPIGEVVKAGQEIMVQVTKGPMDLKGARATRRVSLPSRYLVLVADGRNKVGVSKKIDDEGERKRLRDLAQKVRPDGFSLIVRTRAEGATVTDFEDDIKFLLKIWRSIQNRSKQVKAPALIYEDTSLVYGVFRDIFDAEVDSFVVNDKVAYDRVLNLCANVAPHLRNRVELYRGEEPIATHYGIQKQIERALRPKVWLPHGGHIVIEQTEALTTIDVNTGKFVAAKSLEDTVLRTNLEAAEEIARQLRLRDIGGIIVIDFIDMDNRRHRRKVTEALRDAFSTDRMKTRILHITRLGLVEMTRKRTGPSLGRQFQVACPCCEGRGRILSAATVAQRIVDDLRAANIEQPHEAYLVWADPEVTLTLIGPHGEYMPDMEKTVGANLYVRCTTDIHPEHYEIIGDTDEQLVERHLPHKVGQILAIDPADIISAPAMGLVVDVDGYIVEIPEVSPKRERMLKARLTRVDRSYGRASPVSSSSG